MKIQCDVCGKEEAYMFCTADEAALCQACDCRVHRANKLASKHPRFSLLHPSSIDSPRCDICRVPFDMESNMFRFVKSRFGKSKLRFDFMVPFDMESNMFRFVKSRFGKSKLRFDFMERRALLFYQEDRALLCRECDIPIHKANEYTKNHNRFLLTGIKLSGFAASYQASTSFRITGCDNANKNFQTNSNVNTSESILTTFCRVHNNGSDQSSSQEGSVSTNSISDYLIETLPGWHVEELLDPSAPPYVFCKINDQIISPSTNDDEVESNFILFSSNGIFRWSLQTPTSYQNLELLLWIWQEIVSTLKVFLPYLRSPLKLFKDCIGKNNYGPEPL